MKEILMKTTIQYIISEANNNNKEALELLESLNSKSFEDKGDYLIINEKNEKI